MILDADVGRLPETLDERYREICGGEPDAAVAVRSSAIGEDSALASYAGQYETLLDVRGEVALREAVRHCLASLDSAQASAYRAAQGDPAPSGDDAPRMCVVVQRMVEPRVAGVLFTADPVSGRRGQPVVDAVAGLGEALVSGEASPDHYVLDRKGRTLHADLLGDQPLLSDDERARLLSDAIRAEQAFGQPLDLEWAIDASGRIEWLQARPITRLPADPCALDTAVSDPEHVYTRCNVGEMFPGACTPLSLSFTARAIDVGMQRMHQRVGIQEGIREDNRFIAMFHGQLFLNLSTIGESATHAIGSSIDQMAQSVCGRPVTELEIRSSEPPPLPRRLANGLRYLRYLFGRGHARRAMAMLRDHLRIREGSTGLEQWQAIDDVFEAIFAAMDHHLVSSASSGVLTPLLLGLIAKGETPREEDHALVAALLAQAGDVESADVVTGSERIADQVAAHPDGLARFVDASADQALAWIESRDAGAAHDEWRRYLARHGHRAIKELELRQREWADDPLPLVRSLQAPLRAGVGQIPERASPPAPTVEAPTRLIRWLTKPAQNAVRAREETKSGLVMVTTHFKRAYRRLGDLLTREGALPDADAVFFLTHDELGRLVARPSPHWGELAASRRETFNDQDALEFPDVFKGAGEPIEWCRDERADPEEIHGSAVSRGVVRGPVRIVRSLDEADALQAGEILVAPITDVGWTPYFSLIGGLVTDIGSAVSHGAVVAREYGLPAVVNTRVATRALCTGDWVELDGERGRVRKIEAPDSQAPGTRAARSAPRRT